jgi:outer membrane protein
MKKQVYIVCFFAFILHVKAQEKAMKLSMSEAVEFAIENSYNAKSARNNIKSANKKVWETTTIGLPQISANVAYQNFLKQPVSLLPAAAFDNREAVVETVEDFFNLNRASSPDSPDGFIPVVFGTQQNINATLTLTQLVFDGSYLVGLQAAKTFLTISQQAEEKTILRTREAVINAYGNVLVTEKSITILEQNITILQKNFNDAQKIYENGLNEEEDVQQLEITLGNVKNQLNSVVKMKEIAYQMLNLSLGNPIKTPLILTDSLEGLAEDNVNLALIAAEFNFLNHIDFKISENNKETQRLIMKLEQSKALPSLSAFINYGTQGFSDSFSFFDSKQQWFDSSLFGVNLQVPIFSSFGRKARTSQAKIGLENADIQLEETKQRLQILAKKAKIEYQLSIKNYGTAKKNIGLAERIEKKQRIKFFEGISSSFDLLQAQNQLYAQQQNYIQAMLSVISKKATLENALNIPIK